VQVVDLRIIGKLPKTSCPDHAGCQQSQVERAGPQKTRTFMFGCRFRRVPYDLLLGLALGTIAAFGVTLGNWRRPEPRKGALCPRCSGEASTRERAIPGEKAMQYLLMCCFDEAQWAELSDADRGRIMGEYGKLIHELKTSGRLLTGAKLDQCASAVTVRQQNGKPFITDGPFAETREQLGGYHLIDCKDRDEAVAIALRIPTLPAGGAIEVRPLLRLE
jgi:hypothetical protein